PFNSAFSEAILDHHILAFDVTGFGKTATECVHEVCGRSGRLCAEIPHHRHCRLLRARRERPRRRASEQRDEVAPFHSITSSAATSSLSGTVRPSILAVWALRTSAKLVDCTPGRPAGWAPWRMRPA